MNHLLIINTSVKYFSSGPTLKLRRPIVSKMFKDKIDAFYEEA